MKCANPDCSCPEIPRTDPCVVCGLGVHHLCSNDLYEGKLTERFCSAACLYKWKTVTAPPMEGENVSQDSSTSTRTASQLADSQISLVPLSQSSVPTSPASSSVEPTIDLTQQSDVSTGVDAFGIPLNVVHYRQQGRRHAVWDIMHRLDVPFETKDDKYATHVCLLCAQDRSCNPYAAPESWEHGLHRLAHSTNALDHMVANHQDHSISKAYSSIKMKNAVRHVNEAMTVAYAQERKRATATAIGARLPKKGALQKLWMPSQKELCVYISYWLINAGLPYNTVATEDFKRLIQRATGDTNAAILSASTYRDLLGAVFSKFCKSVAKLLLREFELAHHAPFLNLLHDTWTTANGKKGALGTSIRWIDETWTFREVALLVSVAFGSHALADMQRMICTRVKQLYGLDIDTMAQFAVSDTTPSARKVSKHFEEALPTDCYMHVINLCLQYALVIRENKETVVVYDPITNTKKRKKRYCTVGGVFEEGRLLIRRVRDLNNYFCTEQRCQRLEEVHAFYSLPKLTTGLDCEARVAYTVRLFQRSIVNYSAFQGYFQKCDSSDDAAVFQRLDHDDWLLMAELEAIVGAFADLARAEVQQKDLVASELIVLLKYTVDRLRCDQFMVCDIDAARSATTTISSFPRYPVQVEELSTLSRTCLDRLKGQVERRIALATPETVLILLLDPRTKFSVESLLQRNKLGIDGGANAQDAEQVRLIIDAGRNLLLNAHREVFRAMNASSSGVEEASTPSTLPNLGLIPSAEENKSICGAPINLNSRPVAPSTLNDRADKVLQDWMEYRVDWLDVAKEQATVETMTDDYSPLLLVLQDGAPYWRVEGLCEFVGILSWFRVTGCVLFPSIAALARAWLGRSPSNAFQERVFSTGGFIMSNLRTRTDNQRAGMQVLLRHNRDEIRQMERLGDANI